MEELTIGQRIAVKRRELGLSQIALGEKMGVSRQSISKWEADAAIIAPPAAPARAAFHRRDPIGIPKTAQAPAAVPKNGKLNRIHIPPLPFVKNFHSVSGYASQGTGVTAFAQYPAAAKHIPPFQ